MISFERNSKMTTRPGFTLSELLIYMAVSTIIIVVISTFMIDVSRSAARNRVSLELQANARYATAQIAQDVRTTGGVVNVLGGDTLVVGSNRYCAFNGAVIKTSGANCTTAPTAPEILTNNQVTVPALGLTFSNQGSTYTMSLTLESAVPNTPIVPQQTIITTLVPRRSIYQS